jgi:hypothetical protein
LLICSFRSFVIPHILQKFLLPPMVNLPFLRKKVTAFQLAYCWKLSTQLLQFVQTICTQLSISGTGNYQYFCDYLWFLLNRPYSSLILFTQTVKVSLNCWSFLALMESFLLEIYKTHCTQSWRNIFLINLLCFLLGG